MQFETILFAKDAGVAVITLNRPEQLNAMSDLMMKELGAAIQDIAHDDEAHCLVIKAAGRAFCAGGDVGRLPGGKEQPKGAEEIRQHFLDYVHPVALGLQRLQKPTIAMIQGVAVGAGFDLACACDIRYGSENARFMCAFTRIGLFPGWGGCWLYPRVMGVGHALEFLYTGDFVEAQEAKELGILNKLVPAEKLDEETMTLARKIAVGPPIAQRLAKMQVYQGLNMDFEAALLMAAACETITLTSQDHKEGVAAFKEKRAPVYKGK